MLEEGEAEVTALHSPQASPQTVDHVEGVLDLGFSFLQHAGLSLG